MQLDWLFPKTTPAETYCTDCGARCEQVRLPGRYNSITGKRWYYTIERCSSLWCRFWNIGGIY